MVKLESGSPQDSIFGTSPTLQHAKNLQVDASTNLEGVLATAATKLQQSALASEQQRQAKKPEPSSSPLATRSPGSQQKEGTTPLAAQTPPSQQKLSVTPQSQIPPARRQSRATPQAKGKTPSQTPRRSQSPQAIAGKGGLIKFEILPHSFILSLLFSLSSLSLSFSPCSLLIQIHL